VNPPTYSLLISYRPKWPRRLLLWLRRKPTSYSYAVSEARFTMVGIHANDEGRMLYVADFETPTGVEGSFIASLPTEAEA
jgi:hypothetical protein